MIFGNINDLYQNDLLSQNPSYKLALDYIKTLTVQDVNKGSVILNENVKVNFLSMNSQIYDGNKYEVHNKYVDIQYVIEGCDDIYIAPRKDLQITTPYSDEKDVAFGTCQKYTKMTLHSGDYLIIFPEEAHFPACGDQSLLNKCIAKIKI